MNRLYISIALFLTIVLSSCTVVRSLRWWQPDLSDSSKFNNVNIAKSASPFNFTPANDQLKYKKLKIYLDSMLVNTNTNAFLVIKNDSIIYEHFAAQTNAQTLHPSFSIAKSYIGTLTGIAIDKGIIHSADDLVIKYLPELEKNDPRFQRLTLQHVLDMRSGVDFDEDKETPFAGIAKLYYGSSIRNQISKLKMKREPGKAFEYQSINTQLLAMVLERASGEKMTTLFAKYIWDPLGTESNALWSTDDQKTAKASCCLNATASDFAKLGRLYLKKGNWNGQQVVSTKWVNETVNPDTLMRKNYKNQWWANAGKANDYRAEGILGQILYVNPNNNVIIVRMGAYPNKNLYFNGFIPRIGREL